MKRTLLVASLAMLSAASAYAQSNVTIYGRVNVSVERQKTGGTTDNVVADNSSRIGFRGTEDLGGGLKAVFTIEHGFDPTTGQAASATFWNREATVGLAGGFGKVLLGKTAANEAYFATADYVSMHNHDTGSSSDALTSIPGATFGLNNSVSYYSPAMGGFNFAVQTAERVAGERPLVVAGNYDAGPLHLGLGYAKYGTDKSLGLRALYELGAFTVGGYYEKGSGTNDVSVIRLAGMYTMGASEFHLNVGSRGDLNDIADTGAKQMTLGYNYNLSKRTKVYGFYTKLNADTGADFSSMALGIRHNF